MNPKSVFLEDKELVKWWVSVVHDPRFEKVAVLSIACICQRARNKDHMDGAGDVLDVMEHLADPLPSSTHFPSPGLVHETPKRITDQPKTDKPKA